ncbi:hypothetical protein QP324_08955 [Corynebacterium sp. UMB0012]|uniref:hypothetical protein n=1 Tax=Corynebacterium sp. UMB0012 TaxID=3046344 RepID=UPI00254F9823|nr:hypothetical protein [Corynebacterium sp. UMB0012]MDK7048702.1 hypothetical protein [Corynebacterium sp. UMB0012]
MNLISVYKSRLWKRWYVACGTHIFINTPDWKHAYEAADMLVRNYRKSDLLEFAKQDRQLEIMGEQDYRSSTTGEEATIIAFGWKE